MRCRRPLTITSVAGVAAASLLIAGCGGRTNSPSSSNPSRSAGNPSQVRTQYLRYAACMRSHGVASYPDPQISASANSVSITISPGSADPNSPAFKSADRACHRVLPNGGMQGGPGASTAAQQHQDVLFADCMRSHGVSSFPDPGHDGVFTLPATIIEQAPTYLHALHACQNVQPSSLSIDQSI